VYWNLSALAAAYAVSATDPSAKAAYWEPGIAYIHQHLSPDYRVEVVDTSSHWPATYFPQAGIPLVRGWFRQDDFPQNALLYHPLSSSDYRTWLHSLGVKYVVLSDAPPDHSSVGETNLLTGGTSGLPMVLRTGHLSIYGVPDAQPIVTGPGSPRVSQFNPAGLVINLDQPGTFRIAVRWSPYWQASDGCLGQGPDGMMLVTTNRTGAMDLDFNINPTAALHAFTGAAAPACHGTAATAG
jgi:hypothetical protein